MGVVMCRGRSTEVQIVEPSTPKEAYTSLSEDQFKEFIKLYLKDNIMNVEHNSWIETASMNLKQNLNNFFETLPDYLLCFETDSSRKLIMMYITSNLQYNFGIQLGEKEQLSLYNAIMRIKDVDPRISNK